MGECFIIHIILHKRSSLKNRNNRTRMQFSWQYACLACKKTLHSSPGTASSRHKGCTPIIPALGRWRQENQKFEVGLSSMILEKRNRKTDGQRKRQSERESPFWGQDKKNHFNLYVYAKTKFKQKLTSMLTSKKEKKTQKLKTILPVSSRTQTI